MLSRPRKRSVTINKHNTSVSLEDFFWESFNEIAKKKNKGINELISEIDEGRDDNCGLASAIRLFVLGYYKS
jgi:predicted DNA-binding ribbon-helix-helix protein